MASGTAIAREFSIPFGIWADTGYPLSDLTDSAINAELQRGPGPETVASDQRASKARTFSTVGGLDANDLQQSGWGIVFPSTVQQDVKDALKPLIEHRRGTADPFVIYDGDSGIHPQESVEGWLKRQHVRLDIVDPAKGVPYYLLLVGPPESISFEFQYLLDIYWAVGRIWFDTAEEFRRYAESVVRYETGTSAPTTKQIALFATEHDFDKATQLFTRNVVKPLSEGEGPRPVPIGKGQGFGLKTILGDNATKKALGDVLRGRSGFGTPSLLFTGSHGMAFRQEDPRQSANQGAIVCQDWSGFGKIGEEDWFGPDDVPDDARVHGLMHIFFACYGGGCPEFDNFDRMNSQPSRIASKPFFARLPSRLLSHTNGGALAVLAHIERAWAYSFQDDAGGSQTQGFRDVIGRLLLGDRIGNATDSFNMRWAALSAQLSEAERDLRFGADIPLSRVGRMWIARDDARNFLILGDPATRIRVRDVT